MAPRSNTIAKRKSKASPEIAMRERLTFRHKQAVRELEQIRRVEEYRSMFVRIMMATSPTLIEAVPLHELERIDDWIIDQFDSIEGGPE